jgi:carbohydrate-selective porin OprB
MIYRYGGPGSDIGLTPWIGVTFSPQQTINQLPVFVLAGAAYHGLIPGRGDDNMAFAFYSGKISNELPSITGEKVLERDYTWWATPWLAITPDLQYILNPSGGSSSTNALVLGMQLQILF